VTITALYDERGELHGFAKVTQDVTEQREAERVLREREQQLADAQAIAQLGSFEWDVVADQVTWSPELCRILGLESRTFTSPAEVFVRCFHVEDRPLVMGAIRQAARTGTSFGGSIGPSARTGRCACCRAGGGSCATSGAVSNG